MAEKDGRDVPGHQSLIAFAPWRYQRGRQFHFYCAACAFVAAMSASLRNAITVTLRVR